MQDRVEAMNRMENGDKNRHSNQKMTAPKWLNEDDSLHWLAELQWREAFENEKARLKKAALLRFSKVNGIVVISSLIFTCVIWIIPFDLLLKSPTLISIANISCATAASVTAIIFAFVVFLFGHAKRLEEESRKDIPLEIQRLESVRVQIADYAHAEVRKTASKYNMEKKAQDLVSAAKKYDTSLYELIRRFKMAKKPGSCCDGNFLSILSDHISVRGGDWFVAYLYFSESFETEFNHREFARRVQKDAQSATENLCRLNGNIKHSEDEHQKAFELSLTLPSFLSVVVLAFISIFMANVIGVEGNIAPLFLTWLAIMLAALLITHLILLIYGMILLMQREMMIRAANRQFYLQYATKNTQVNEDEMLKDSLKLLKAHPQINEIVKKLD